MPLNYSRKSYIFQSLTLMLLSFLSFGKWAFAQSTTNVEKDRAGRTAFDEISDQSGVSDEKGMKALVDDHINDKQSLSKGSDARLTEEKIPTRSMERAARPGREDEEPVTNGRVDAGGEGGRGDTVPIVKGASPLRGVNVFSEAPAVQNISVNPANSKGGDETEIFISSPYDVIVKMPESIKSANSSNQVLKVDKLPGSPNLLRLKSAPVKERTPISLHVIDTMNNIYLFHAIAVPADLSIEYPKIITVNRKSSKSQSIGLSEDELFFKGLGVEDAIQYTVGDIPQSNEYLIEIVSTQYNPGIVQYNFRIMWRNKHKMTPIDPSKLVYTFWANDLRLDGGPKYSFSRLVEWRQDEKGILSKIDSRRRNRPVIRVSAQIKASLLELETWRSAFVTIADDTGYSRQDFSPLIRPFRAPMTDTVLDEE